MFYSFFCCCCHHQVGRLWFPFVRNKTNISHNNFFPFYFLSGFVISKEWAKVVFTKLTPKKNFFLKRAQIVRPMSQQQIWIFFPRESILTWILQMPFFVAHQVFENYCLCLPDGRSAPGGGADSGPDKHGRRQRVTVNHWRWTPANKRPSGRKQRRFLPTMKNKRYRVKGTQTWHTASISQPPFTAFSSFFLGGGADLANCMFRIKAICYCNMRA